MDDRPRQLLVQLIAQHGRALVGEPRRCRGLLQDHLAGTCKREVTALLTALEHGIAKALMEGAESSSAELLLGRLTQHLLDQVPFDAAAAFWAVESWALALGVLTAQRQQSTPRPQSGTRPAQLPLLVCPTTAPRPQSGTRSAQLPLLVRPITAPRLGSVELVVPLRDIMVTLHTGDTVTGDVHLPLTIDSPLGGWLEVPVEELVSLDGAWWTFADGTMLQGAITNGVLEVTTPRRVRILRMAQLQPLHYQPATVTGQVAEGLCISMVSGDFIVGQFQGSLTFQNAAETLHLELDEIVSLVSKRLTLDDGIQLTGKVVAPDPLVVQTRYGVLHVPAVQVQSLYRVLVNSLGMVFVRIPAGEFRMGSDKGSDDEKPVHLVRISRPFDFGMFPVTQGQWRAVMQGNPSAFAGDPRRPVEQVSWRDVQDFIRRLNFRERGVAYHLPTEAEWEYAARAGSTMAYCFGDDARQLERYARYDKNSGRTTYPVGQLRPNTWGLYDIHGNVWEWVQDWYDGNTYARRGTAGAAAVDPTGPLTGSNRVRRGGSWNRDAGRCRAAVRGFAVPGVRGGDLGFRLLREVS